MLRRSIVFISLLMVCFHGPLNQTFAAPASMRVLYPSFGGTWATAWIAKEAGYFSAEGLDVELIRVGGSTRMVAAMLGGSAPIIQAGAVAAIAATAAGSDVVIIAATGNVSSFHLFEKLPTPKVNRVYMWIFDIRYRKSRDELFSRFRQSGIRRIGIR